MTLGRRSVGRPVRRVGRRVARRVAAVVAAGVLVGTCGTVSARADEVRDGQWYLSALGITKAQSITRGQGVTVAVIDTGVDGSVPDMRGAVVGGADFSGKGSANGQRSVNNQHHGTHVASLIAARGTGSDTGVIGVAPEARLLTASVDILADVANGQVPRAIRWSVDHGATVINISLVSADTTALVDALRYAEQKNVVVVTASGNDGAAQNGGAPCGLAGVVCVGGIDENLQHDPDSNTDPKLTIVGPYATKPGATRSANPRLGLPVVEPGFATNTYAGGSGTSLAAPVVAGTVALIRSKYPKLDAANVVNRLIRTATPAGGSTPNATYGYGIVDADKALTADVPTVRTNPLGSLTAATTSPATSAGGTGSPDRPGSSSPVIGAADDSSGSSTGVIVGVVVAVIVVAGVVTYLLVRRRTPRRLVS